MVTPLSLPNLQTPATAEEWNNAILALQQTLGLPTTAWQPGSVERVIDAAVANVQQQSDVAASIMVQAGFLPFAASGSVTYTDATGAVVTIFVTPDPSNPAQNPDGALGWLDVLADGVYDAQRILTLPASGTLAVVNASVTTYGPFAAGTYHAAQTSGPTYANTADIATIPPTSAVGAISLVDAGGGGEIRITVGTAPATGTLVAIVGVGGVAALAGTTAWLTTHVNATQFTLDGSTFAGSPTLTAASIAYLPQEIAFSADATGSASDAAPNTVTLPITSLSGITIANPLAWAGSDTESNAALAARCRLKLAALAVGQPGGAYTYYALLALQLAPTLTPPQTLSAAVTKSLVTLDVTTGTVYVTIAGAGGGPTSGDVAVVQAVEDAYVGTTTTTCVVQAAADHSIACAIKVYLPAAYNTATNQAYFAAAILAYFRGPSLPIGGVTDTGGTSPATNVVPYNAVLGSVWQAAKVAGIPLQQVEGTIAGGTSNVQLLLTPIPEVAVPSISVTMVSV